MCLFHIDVYRHMDVYLHIHICVHTYIHVHIYMYVYLEKESVYVVIDISVGRSAARPGGAPGRAT